MNAKEIAAILSRQALRGPGMNPARPRVRNIPAEPGDLERHIRALLTGIAGLTRTSLWSTKLPVIAYLSNSGA